MARRALIDANVILRYLLADDPRQSLEAVDLLENAPKSSLYLSAIIIAELTWALRSHFQVPRDQVSASIQRVMALPSITVDEVVLDAVARYATANVDFADCALAAASSATGLPVVTFDRDFAKFGDMTAQRPSEFLDDLSQSGSR